MALRGTIHHRKTKRLAAALGIHPCYAMGVMEALWHATADHAPEGNIGRLTNEDIAMEMCYPDDPDTLIDALVEVKLLDKNEKFRLVVHNWAKRADFNTKRKLLRYNKQIIDGEEFIPIVTKRGETMKKPASISDSEGDTEAKENPPKAPPPKNPHPNPEPIKIAKGIPKEGCELVYAAYPRKVGKEVAIKAIAAAVQRLGEGRDIPPMEPPEALQYLRDRAAAFAVSPAGCDGEFTPHPATWFNAGRYLDDDNEWQKGGNHAANQGTGNHNAGRVSPAEQRRRENLAGLANIAARRYGLGPLANDGANKRSVPESENQRRNAGDVPSGVGGNDHKVRTGGVSARVIEGNP